MSRTIQWGVIGCGGIARRRTIPEGLATASNAKLAAVFDVNVAANQEVAAQFGARAYATMDELLASDVDAVYIATPVYLHCEQTLAAIAAGKHVLCEKPLGMSVAEAERMAGAAAQAGVKLGTALMMRFLAQHQAARKLIADGSLGRPVLGRAQLSCWYPRIQGAWRQDPTLGGGGSLIDMGGHSLDLLEMFFGNIKKVSCFANTIAQDYASEDSALAMLWFENGALGMVDAFFSIPDASSDNALELYGTRGCILAKGTIGQASQGRMVARLEGGAAGYDARQQRAEAGEIEIAPEPVNPYRAEIEEFSQAILDNRAPAVDAAIGVRSQRVLAACYESARTGKAVDVL
jgi:predicted dehydrogenase